LKFFSVIFVVVFAFGCGNRKETVKLKAIRNIKLVEVLSDSQLDFEWFNAKISTTIDTEDTKKSFKTVVKMRKDSVIWLSISPLLGIEMARVIITPDSLKMMDKVNNQYFLGELDYLGKSQSIDLDFNTIQQMVVSNALMFDDNEKFKSIKSEDSYMITAKTKRKVRKSVGMKNGNNGTVMTKDTVNLEIDEKKFRKAIKKNEEDDLIIKRYWLSPDYNRPIRALITDILYDRIVEVDYSDFEKQDSTFFPQKVDYNFKEKDKSLSISIKYNRMKINNEQSFPFNIPKDFERIYVNNEN